MERKLTRILAVYLSFFAAITLFLLLSICFLGGERLWLGEILDLSGIWDHAPCVSENSSLAAALEEDSVRSILREWSAERLTASLQGMAIPERKLTVLQDALYHGFYRAAEKQGLAEYSAGVERLAQQAADSAGELWAWIGSVCEHAEDFLPVGLIKWLLFLSDTWITVSLFFLFVVFELLVLRMSEPESRWLWLSLPPLFCAGGCLVVCGSGTEKSLAGQLAARLFEKYYGAGILCFSLCAVFIALYALPKQSRYRERRFNSGPVHPKGP